MGCYDTFRDGPEREAQIKALDCCLYDYKPGDEVRSLIEFDFPLTCTFADWGGSCTKYKAEDLVSKLLKEGTERNFGVFVVIEGGIFLYITEEIDNVVYPVFDKYGCLLDEGPDVSK